MVKSVSTIRGMSDILPEYTKTWRFLEQLLADLFESYGYRQIRTPVLESTDLFRRSIGEITDIVEKEMYTFKDRNKDLLTLRPEGTTPCVRAVLEHRMISNANTQKLWYLGPMFRHERPQKGRYRQFHQAAVEAFNISSPHIDAELIMITQRLWKKLKIQHAVKLEINSLGNKDSRTQYRQSLTEYLGPYIHILNEEQQYRFKKNPLRILDTKNPKMQEILLRAPKLIDYLDKESQEHFEDFKERLAIAGIPYRINPYLVRGLDYYNRTVFEWVTDMLGSQSTICGGGRYDDLVRKMGGNDSPGVGFAIGMERIILIMEALNEIPSELSSHKGVYFCTLGRPAEIAAITLSENLRDSIPSLYLETDANSGNLKKQLKKADKSIASHALILGEDELSRRVVLVKNLREDMAQKAIPWEMIPSYLSEHIR